MKLRKEIMLPQTALRLGVPWHAAHKLALRSMELTQREERAIETDVASQRVGLTPCSKEYCPLYL
ncbi:MAG: hypothetical protein ACREOG_20930, partial [Gemmatimonadaceae bacterium]